jgi:hypothetical protein
MLREDSAFKVVEIESTYVTQVRRSLTCTCLRAIVMIWEFWLLVTILTSDDRQVNEEIEVDMRNAHHKVEPLAELVAHGSSP